jgi:hypothetical protein
MAAKAGKDVYSEKPCGLTIANCQELADTMQCGGRIFQVGLPDNDFGERPGRIQHLGVTTILFNYQRVKLSV